MLMLLSLVLNLPIRIQVTGSKGLVFFYYTVHFNQVVHFLQTSTTDSKKRRSTGTATAVYTANVAVDASSDIANSADVAGGVMTAVSQVDTSNMNLSLSSY